MEPAERKRMGQPVRADAQSPADEPAGAFLLFGMGPGRRKLVYRRGGRLLDALTLEVVRAWEPVDEAVDPAACRVTLREADGGEATVAEDEEGVWVEEGGDRVALTRGERVRLPRFDGHPYAAWLRALHAELLVNLMPAGPVPNLWVYPRPWYRDAAMMLMCLERAGNLPLVEPWVMGLHRVWDRNNRGEPEADNPGQVLYMLSLFGARGHPMVRKVLDAVPACRTGGHIAGRTDYREHPVYQTKWLKFGLRALGMDDPLTIPAVYDPYSALFWMDFREEHVEGERFSAAALAHYPYLHWAEAHFHGEAPPEPLDRLQTPLTREGAASEAEYWRLGRPAEAGVVAPRDVAGRVCRPHTWHAAEMFLYLIEQAPRAGAAAADG